jgi:beta-lactamase superfamily II metal-dependent hydrolase
MPKKIICFLVVLLSLLWLAACQPPFPRTPLPGGEPMTVLYLDIGQGDSTLIQSPGGKIMLIDGGNGASDANEVILPALRELGASKIDILVVTHPDQDHIGGLPEIIESFPVDRVFLTGQLHATQTYERLLLAIRDEGLTAVQTRVGTPLDFDPALTVQILSPTDEQVDSDDTNNASVVIRLSYGNVRFLFLGDAEEEAETVMLASGAAMQAQILKVGHHGSRTSTNQPLLEAVKPVVGIISAGADNRYGHPHPEVLNLLKGAGVDTFRTDQQGSIRVTTDGSSYEVFTER